MDDYEGFTLTEVSSVKASAMKVISCHFSADGKWLVTAGHDKRAVLWYADELKPKTTFEGHLNLITDVCFSPRMPYNATSSFDRRVKIWYAGSEPRDSFRTFMGHFSSVMSADFHPNRDDLICSCDGDGEIRYWNINDSNCEGVFKGGNSMVRFQPRLGRYLAAAGEKAVSILDVETQNCRHSLQGHYRTIHSVCWDPSGEYLASTSEDTIRVWTFGSGNEGECIRKLSLNDNKFYSTVFHPTNPSLLIIGCYQSLVIWDMTENKTTTLQAHRSLIASLAVSTATRMIASVSHDKFVKLWK